MKFLKLLFQIGIRMIFYLDTQVFPLLFCVLDWKINFFSDEIILHKASSELFI